MKYFLSSLIMLFIFSCNTQVTEVEMALKECVNEEVNKNIKEAYGKNPFDFYKFILEIEKEFISNEILKSKDKESYLEFFDSFNKQNDIEYSKMYEKQNSLIDKYGFTPFSTEIIFNQCPYKVSVESKENKGKLIYSQGVILNKLMKSGYDDENLIKELISVTDENNFDKVVYRAPIILLMMINLDNKFNPDLKELKENQKGKSFLKKTKNK